MATLAQGPLDLAACLAQGNIADDGGVDLSAPNIISWNVHGKKNLDCVEGQPWHIMMLLFRRGTTHALRTCSGHWIPKFGSCGPPPSFESTCVVECELYALDYLLLPGYVNRRSMHLFTTQDDQIMAHL